MFINLLVDFCLLFTFTVLIYWPFIHHVTPTMPVFKYKPYIVGVCFGVVGILFIISSLYFSENIMTNARIIPLLFSGLLGGPVALLLSGAIMGIGRFFLPALTDFAFIVNINFIVLVVVASYISQVFPFSKKNIIRYFWFMVFEIGLLLLFSLNFSIAAIDLWTLFMFFSVLSFYIIYFVLDQVERAHIRMVMTEHLARTDYLTQLPNSHAIEKEINQLLVKRRKFTLLQVDINNFKYININYGYTTGDTVLQQVSKILKEYANKNGAFAGRISGEEFIIILKDIAPAHAIYQADIINKIITQYEFDTSSETKLSITTTIGLTSSPDNGEDLSSLLKSASEAQHRAREIDTDSFYHANNIKSKRF